MLQRQNPHDYLSFYSAYVQHIIENTLYYLTKKIIDFVSDISNMKTRLSKLKI